MNTRYWRDVCSRIRNERAVAAAVLMLAFFVVIALLAGAGVVGSHWKERAGSSFQPPGWDFPLGTDLLGRSVFQKLLYGAKISLSVAFIGSFIAVLLGGTLGMMAGCLGRRADDLVVWLCSTFSAVPGVLMLCAVAAILQDAQIAGWRLKGIPAICLALGLTHWVGTCRLVRGEVLRLRERDFILASRALGSGALGIITRHLLPHCLHLLLYDGFLHCAGFIRAEVMLSFFGIGSTDQSSWGVMLDDARFEMTRNVWWPMAAVALLVFVFTLAIHSVGEVLRDTAEASARTT